MMHCCEMFMEHLDSEDTLLIYVPKFREFGIQVPDGGSSYIVINYCPFCGANFPRSLREAWFERLDRLGIEPGDELPSGFNSDSWWRSEGL